MKKLIALLAMVALALCLCACGGSGSNGGSESSGSTTPSGTTPSTPEPEATSGIPSQYYGTWQMTYAGGEQFAEYSDEIIKKAVQKMRDEGNALIFRLGDVSTLEYQGVVYEFTLEKQGDDSVIVMTDKRAQSEILGSKPVTMTFNADGTMDVTWGGGSAIYTFAREA